MKLKLVSINFCCRDYKVTDELIYRTCIPFKMEKGDLFKAYIEKKYADGISSTGSRTITYDGISIMSSLHSFKKEYYFELDKSLLLFEFYQKQKT